MTIDDNIRDEKWQYDINREAAKISALSSQKIDEKNQGEKQIKALEEHRKKLVESNELTY